MTDETKLPEQAADTQAEGQTPPDVEQEPPAADHDPSALVDGAATTDEPQGDQAQTESEALAAAFEAIQAMAGVVTELPVIRNLQVARNLPTLPEGQVGTPVQLPEDQISAFKDEDGETMLVVLSGGALFKAKAEVQQ